MIALRVTLAVLLGIVAGIFTFYVMDALGANIGISVIVDMLVAFSTSSLLTMWALKDF